MSEFVHVELAPLDHLAQTGQASAEGRGGLIVFAGLDGAMAPASEALLGGALAQVRRAAAAAEFKGKQGSFLDIYAPAGLEVDRLIIAGCAPKGDAPLDFAALGGAVMGKIGRGAHARVALALPAAETTPADAAAFALGLQLRAYRFDAYKKKKKADDAEKEGVGTIVLGVKALEAVRAAMREADAVAQGVAIARTLVNEPANILYPVEFAARAKALEKVGCEVEILDMAAMTKLGMGALLGVGQGSVRESRVAIIRWNGAADAAAQPVAFVGKGVCFDTGGISIKPAGGMEDMKGDMAGAACVVGLMHALAARGAKVNAIGAIGLVENMPGANAQRPGDIVTSMSGQTIEIINTDAEGRLVLADVLWYVQDRYKPVFMIDLATLTGAIIVALGQEYAGLFSNDDGLSDKLTAAGKQVGEKVWRFPMGPTYDKMIDSKFADMKNTGGRHGGSISAAQFIARFVNGTPWAHLDIAGTGMGSPSSDINQSWGSGWGVRLLDRLVADHYEG